MSWIKKEEKIIKKDIIASEKLVWKYHNLVFLILSLVVAVFILKSEFIKEFILNLGKLEYIGVFISGMFFSYGLTTAPSISMLYLLSRNLNPFLVGIMGMLGAVVSDYLIFRFVKYGLIKEIKAITDKFKFHPHLKKPYIKFLKAIAPLIAGLIIASPLPDELAASILGAIKVKDGEFLVISILSNFIGILVIALI